MTLGRNARRRLALYGGATVVAVAILLLPRLAERSAPAIPMRRMDLEGAKRHEATRLLVSLVKADTSEPPGITRPAVEILANAFACDGIPYEIVGDDPQRPLILARIAGRTRQGALLLLAHLDVVDAGDPARWMKPAFAAEMGTGRDAAYLYGRGTLDMKGQAAADVYAMARLVREGIVPERDILFLGETGEESYRPEIGIGWIFQHRPDLLEGITDVYNEGGVNETVGQDIQRFGIEVMQKAALNYLVDSPSKSALEELGKFCEEHNRQEPYEASPQVLDYLSFIGPSRSDVWGRSMIEPQNALRSERFKHEAPEVYQTLVRDWLYHGPAKERKGHGFEMEVAYTLLPGRSVAQKRAEMEGWFRARGLTFRPQLVTGDCVASPTSGRGWDTLYRALSLDPVEKAVVGDWILTGSYTNSSYVRAHGLNAYGVSPFNVNIFDASTIHHEGERILLPYFVDGAERMARIVREFATAP